MAQFLTDACIHILFNQIAMLFNGKSHIVFQNEGDLELLRQMPERADIKQFLKVWFILHIQDNIFATFNMGIR